VADPKFSSVDESVVAAAAARRRRNVLTEGAERQSDWDSGRCRETVRDGETSRRAADDETPRTGPPFGENCKNGTRNNALHKFTIPNIVIIKMRLQMLTT
jgi:hypothetical protein